MENKKIFFTPCQPELVNEVDHVSQPLPASKFIPDWFVKMDRFAKNPITGEYVKATKGMCPMPKEGTTDDYGRIPTWKACPALLDVFVSGYMLRTPCDIKFEIKNNRIDGEVLDPKFSRFLQKREVMPGFPQPEGFHQNHFAWFGNWEILVPAGYSVLYTHPMNRFDLPFQSVSGFIDTDKVGIPGSFPFFIKKGWEGIVPAGTPYAQIIPFLRESWESTVNKTTAPEIYMKIHGNMAKFRKPDGGVYARDVWEVRKYT